MAKRSNSIVAVTIAKFATMYVEAVSPEQAVEIAQKHMEEYIDDEDFEDSDIYVHSYETYTTPCEDWMDKIWADGKVKSHDEYLDELEEEEEEL